MLKSLAATKAVVKIRSTSWKVLLAVFAVIALIATGGMYGLTSYLQANYSPEKLAAVMSQSMHRKITIGAIKWNVRWSGLVVHTEHAEIYELNGRPFIKSGPTELSIALTPLLRGEFYPKHLDFANPEIWAVRLSDNRWNFSDLPEFDAIQDISHVACYNGKLHVLDVTKRQANHRPIRVDLTDISFKLDRPFGRIYWPYALSLTIPDTKYKTHISVSGTGSGDLSEWKHKKYSVDAKVDGADPKDFWVFGFVLPEIEGPLKLQFNGEGVLTKEFKTSLLFENPQLRADIKKVEYKGDMLGRLLDVKGKPDAADSAHTAAAVAAPGADEATKAAKNSEATAAAVVAGSQSGGGEVSTLKAPPATKTGTTASGEAVTVKGDSDTKVIQAQTIANFDRKSLNGEIKFEGGSFFLPTKKIGVDNTKGKLVCKDGVITLEQIDGKVGPGAFDLKGVLNDDNKLVAQVDIRGQDFSIIKEWLRVLNISDAQEQAEPVSGTLKSAHIDLQADQKNLAFKLDAEPAGLFYQPKGQPKIVELNGGLLHYDGKSFTLDKVKGELGEGGFVINGKLGLAGTSPIDVTADATNVDLDKARNLLHAMHLTLPKTPADVMVGQMRNAKLRVQGDPDAPEMSLKSEIGDIYVQDKSKSRVFQLTKGTIIVNKNVVTLDKLSGRIGKSDFDLNGTAKMSKEAVLDVSFKARNLEISNAKVALDQLKIQSPLLAESLLFGTVKDLSMQITGPVSTPAITMSCSPDNIAFEPLGTDKPMHIQGGHMDYQHDSLDVEGVTVTTAKSNLKASLTVEKLSSTARVTKVWINTPGLGLADLNAYLSAEKAPPMVRAQYLGILKKFVITNPYGFLIGTVAYQANPGTDPTIKGKVQVKKLSVNAAGFALHDVNGDVAIDNNVVTVNGLQGNLGDSTFTAKGSVSDVLDTDKRNYDLTLTAQVAIDDFLRMIGNQTDTNIQGLKTLALTGTMQGVEKNKNVKFSAQVDPKAAVVLKTPFGEISKAAGMPGVLQGNVQLTPTQLVVDNTQIKVGVLTLNLKGTCDNYSNLSMSALADAPTKQTETIPSIDFHLWTPDFTPVQDLMSYVPGEADEVGHLTGSFRGGVYLKGPLNALAIKGGAGLRDVSINKLNLSHVTGGFRMPDWFNLPTPGTKASQGVMEFNFASATLQKLPVANLKGKLISAEADVYKLEADADIAKGKMSVRGEVKASTAAVKCHLALKVVDSKQLMAGLFNAPNEVTGLMDLDSEISTSGMAIDVTKDVVATGSLNVANGKIPRMALLAHKINQANLLKSGILGFNLNNVITSIAPGESGDFKKVAVKYNLTKGSLGLNSVEVQADDLKVNLKGTVNLTANSIKLDASGSVPKINTEGPLGSVAPLLGVHLFKDVLAETTSVLTASKLSSGSSSSADRSFAFSAKGTFDKLEGINDSIYKSFHWLTTNSSSSSSGSSSPTSPANSSSQQTVQSKS